MLEDLYARLPFNVSPETLDALCRDLGSRNVATLLEARGGDVALLYALAPFYAQTGDGFATCEALYWACVGCWDGQGDPLYALASSLGFSPSPLRSEPESEDAQSLCACLCRIFTSPGLVDDVRDEGQRLADAETLLDLRREVPEQD